MATKTYRLKVRKIPLSNSIQYKKPNFPSFHELHMDLLENKTKLKKNPPKPIFVRIDSPKDTAEVKENFSAETVDEDFTLDELERAYRADSDSEDHVFSDTEKREPENESESESEAEKNKGEYRQQHFEKAQEEELDEEEKERQDKANLLFKFMVLRRQYPGVEIPEFTEHSDFSTMKRVYEQIIRKVSLDSSVDNYKQYLVGGLMVMEWVSTNWLGIDLGGFTQQQAKMMNRYDRLLVELGEKNYSSLGSRFPVEVRLIFLVLFHAGLFYVQKMIFSGQGGMNILNTLFSGPATPQPPPQPNNRRRGGMKGPTISPHDVEELSKQTTMSASDVDE